jgi:hypothetical protein
MDVVQLMGSGLRTGYAGWLACRLGQLNLASKPAGLLLASKEESTPVAAMRHDGAYRASTRCVVCA